MEPVASPDINAEPGKHKTNHKGGAMKLRVLNLDQISPDPNQPHTNKPDEYIRSLGESIAANGLDNPIHVRIDPDNPDRFIIINGECRYLAHRKNPELMDKGTIHAFVKDVSDKTEAEVFMDQIRDNDARLNMGFIETLNAYQKALDMGASMEDLAASVGKSQAGIEADLPILKLPESMQKEVEDGKLSKAVARRIAEFDTESRMRKAHEWAKEGKGVKGMLAKIAAYENSQNQIALFSLKSETPEEVKAAGKAFDRLKTAVMQFKNTPYSNGSCHKMVAARSKNLNLLEETAREMKNIAETILQNTTAFKAQSKNMQS